MGRIRQAEEAFRKVLREELGIEPSIKIYVHDQPNKLSADEAKAVYEKLLGDLDLNTVLDNVLLKNGRRCYSGSSIGNVDASVLYKQPQ